MLESTENVAGEPATSSRLVFSHLKDAVSAQFKRMGPCDLFRTEATGDELWEIYLASFPEGTNRIHRKRAVHDCSCCRQFVRTIGNVVAIEDDKIVSLWDIGGRRMHPAYRTVTQALSALVKSKPIANRFMHEEAKIGTDSNHEMGADGIAKTWGHFFVELPRANDRKIVCAKADIGPALAEARARHDVLLRSLQDLSVEASETVLDLIKQNALYRGEEHNAAVAAFLALKRQFDTVPEADRDVFVWQRAGGAPVGVSKIRNTSIGSLLLDLSTGRDMEGAVGAYERMVAPENYKRSTALVTQAMVERARQVVDELGLTSALDRRFATLADVSVNNVLFADRSARKLMKGGAFEGLATAAPVKPKSMDGLQEVTIEAFLKDILPGADKLEIMVENGHAGNFVSLIAPADQTAKSMFLWDNRFSWSYAGDVADSVKERVKKAGGNVTGDLCCRLAWSNFDDMDLHMTEPGGYEIYFVNKGRLSPAGGTLDVDMNAGGGQTREPVENIVYHSKHNMREGTYELFVRQYAHRDRTDIGFQVDFDFQGDVQTYRYEKPVPTNTRIPVVRFTFSRKDGIKILASLPGSSSIVSRKIWNVDTHAFQRVNVVMLSPNHWDGRGVGNRHYFFMLDQCTNDGSARGFYNEFLGPDLMQHRKVFEILGAKMRAEVSPEQLSGVGFSSTQRNSIVARVSGARTVRVIF
jgi:hypothetical protein